MSDTEQSQPEPISPAPQSQQPRARHRGRGWVVPTALIVGLVAGAGGGAITGASIVAGNTADHTTTGVATAPGSNGVQTAGTTPKTALSKTIQNRLTSVVTVGVVGSQESGTGSGIVLNNDGYIVTNAHVVTLEGETANATITVQTSTGAVYKAKLVGYDPTADVAVIRAADAKGLTPVAFADSDNVQVGDETIAIGAPLGLSGTVTTGIVSALNRPITVASAAVTGQSQAQTGGQTENANGPGVSLSAIQTNAAINSGNSGGALLDATGDLIGMNAAIATSGTSSGSIGIGFAIPSNYVKRIAQEIMKTGHGSHGLLGATVGDYAPASTSFTTGAQLHSLVSGDAAAVAGLKSGDVITALNGAVIESASQLTALIREQAAGSTVTLTYMRDGESHMVTAKLGKSS